MFSSPSPVLFLLRNNKKKSSRKRQESLRVGKCAVLFLVLQGRRQTLLAGKQLVCVGDSQRESLFRGNLGRVQNLRDPITQHRRDAIVVGVEVPLSLIEGCCIHLIIKYHRSSRDINNMDRRKMR